MKLPFRKEALQQSSVMKKKEELLRFVSDQFRELAKKNLRIPVKLFHL